MAGWSHVSKATSGGERFMTSMPVDLHRELTRNEKLPPVPEPCTWRDLLAFTLIGAAIFGILFALMYALGSLQ
jgi:hypothetical protein